MLLSTHIIEDVQSVCDQLVVIDRGQILFTGTPEQLIRSASGHVGVFYEREANQEDGLHITARVNTARAFAAGRWQISSPPLFSRRSQRWRTPTSI